MCPGSLGFEDHGAFLRRRDRSAHEGRVHLRRKAAGRIERAEHLACELCAELRLESGCINRRLRC